MSVRNCNVNPRRTKAGLIERDTFLKEADKRLLEALVEMLCTNSAMTDDRRRELSVRKKKSYQLIGYDEVEKSKSEISEETAGLFRKAEEEEEEFEAEEGEEEEEEELEYYGEELENLLGMVYPSEKIGTKGNVQSDDDKSELSTIVTTVTEQIQVEAIAEWAQEMHLAMVAKELADEANKEEIEDDVIPEED